MAWARRTAADRGLSALLLFAATVFGWFLLLLLHLPAAESLISVACKATVCRGSHRRGGGFLPRQLGDKSSSMLSSSSFSSSERSISAAAAAVEEREDLAAVEEELGYSPPNFVRVSGWTLDATENNGEGNSRETAMGSGVSGRRTRRPVAIQTYPLNGGAERRRAKARGSLTPFPTLYWLCNSDISRAVADLERRGYVKLMEERIRSSDEFAETFRRCHREYAKERWETLTEEDRIVLETGEEEGISERMVNMIRESGVAGTDFLLPQSAEGTACFVPSVKCLHAHYAHYRSGGQLNIVGRWTHDALKEEYPDLEL